MDKSEKFNIMDIDNSATALGLNLERAYLMAQDIDVDIFQSGQKPETATEREMFAYNYDTLRIKNDIIESQLTEATADLSAIYEALDNLLKKEDKTQEADNKKEGPSRTTQPSPEQVNK